jgi:hypothetical protein
VGGGGDNVRFGRKIKWKKTDTLRRKALEAIKALIGSRGFLNRTRKSPEDFTRERKMPFKKLVCFLLSMIKESSQNAPERYFAKAGEVIYMSQQAFSEARKKLKWEGGELFGDTGGEHTAGFLRGDDADEHSGGTIRGSAGRGGGGTEGEGEQADINITGR